MRTVTRDMADSDMGRMGQRWIRINGDALFDGSLAILYIIIFFVIGFLSALVLTGRIF